MNSKLKELGDCDATAKKLFRWLKNDESSYNTLGVTTAEELTGIDYYDLVSTFKELAKIGVGDFIVGRKGHDSRIVWRYDTKSIGIAGLQEQSLFWQFGAVPENAIIALDDSKNKKLNSIKHTFNLRPDFELEIYLPQDFDNNDLHRLKSWLELVVY